MTITLDTLADYLGRPASTVLGSEPYNAWTFSRSIENDLEEQLINYVFEQNGVDLVCDGDDRVTTVFLYSDECRSFTDGVHDLPFSSSRLDVIEILGPPSKSGSMTDDPVLGRTGAWDRFTREGYSIHVEYRVDADGIAKITLMRADVVP